MEIGEGLDAGLLRLVKMQILIWVGLGWGLIVCIFNKLPGATAAAAAAPQPHFEWQWLELIQRSHSHSLPPQERVCRLMENQGMGFLGGKKTERNLKFEDQWSGLQGIPRMLQIL